MVEFKPECKFKPTVLASPVQLEAKQSDQGASDETRQTALQKHDTDLNLYLFKNRVRKEKKLVKPFYSEYPSYKKYCEKVKKVRSSFFTIHLVL